MDPEVRQLRALLAVVDGGSFTAAGDLLGTSQASVSRSVAALERALGARVLRRTTRAVSLTPVGAAVVGHARRVLEEVAAIGRAVEAGRGELRIGYAWAALGRHTRVVQRLWGGPPPPTPAPRWCSCRSAPRPPVSRRARPTPRCCAGR